MMIILRYLLFPFSILYGLITNVRNFLYDKGILKSYSFPIPVIAVGNLSVGGTGKTPQIEYLIRLLSPHYKIATLSRGYKRKSDGFILADRNATAEMLGDEPYQLYLKFPQVQVAVDADRKNGIEKLLASNTKPDIILLDDAFQHRRVKAGFYILLTAYNDLFIHDLMLPTGSLRESRKGAKRANAIIVTKCPPTISEAERNRIKARIGGKAPVYFTYIDYEERAFSENKSKTISEAKASPKLLLAGIAKPQPFFDYLKGQNDLLLEFPDHHHFSAADLENIRKQAAGKLIITTEKDYVRLKNANLSPLFYLPIKSSFISGSEDFDRIVLDFLKKQIISRVC